MGVSAEVFALLQSFLGLEYERNQMRLVHKIRGEGLALQGYYGAGPDTTGRQNITLVC